MKLHDFTTPKHSLRIFRKSKEIQLNVMSFEYLVHAKSYGVLNTRQELLYNPQLRTSWLSSDFSSTRLAGRIQACRSSHLMSLHTTNLVQLKSNCSPPSHSTNLLRMISSSISKSSLSPSALSSYASMS